MARPMNARIREIDVLRGLAALTVVFSHYLPYWDRYLADVPVFLPKGAGYDAVKLFFVISGFVIFMTLGRCRRIADFAFLRASRLYPTYWATLAFVSLVSVLVFGDHFWLGGFVVNATMFQQFLGYPHFDNVYWSLSVEMAFYANVAWLFALGLHRHTHAVVLVWLLLAAVWTVTTHDVGLVTSHAVVAGTPRDWFALLFAFDYAPYFALGILFHDVTQRGYSMGGAVLAALALMVEFLLASWEGVAVACVIGGLFFCAVNGYLRFFVRPVTLWLGTISYSLYLVHRDLGYHALTWLYDHDVGYVTATLATTLAALLLATFFAFAVERPALGRLRAWYKKRHGSMAKNDGGDKEKRAAVAPAALLSIPKTRHTN
jgi:peptidoglycan/LPS O-acetylase OafA/YrhL